MDEFVQVVFAEPVQITPTLVVIELELAELAVAHAALVVITKDTTSLFANALFK